MSLASSTVRRIAKELAQLRSSPPEGCRVAESLDDDDITQFTAWVAGPCVLLPSLAFLRGGLACGVGCCC